MARRAAGGFDNRIGAVLDRKLRLEAGRRCTRRRAAAWRSGGSADERGKAFGRRQLEPVEIERGALRLDQPVGRRAGEIVQRAARRGFGRAQIERVVVVAESVEQIDAQRIEREIERDLEICRQMRAGDLQPVRLEIVDQHLAEAAFLAQRLLGAGGDGREPGSSSSSSPSGVNASRRRHHRPRRRVAGGGRVAGAARSTRPWCRQNSPSSPIVTMQPARARSLSL